MRHVVLSGCAGAVLALALTACGSAQAPGDAAPGTSTSTPSAPSTGAPADAAPTSVGPGQRYVAQAMVLQKSADDPPELCLGGVMESYPPQCGGPEVVGLHWQEVPGRESASGVTWAQAWFVGTYDGTVFRLTQQPSQDPPRGFTAPTPDASNAFPPLCDDPFRGGDPGFDAAAQAGMSAQETLATAAAALDGYVTSYVSDGADDYNVIVTGDAEAAHATLRKVWPGWLCVVQRDLPTAADLDAAQQAVVADRSLPMLSVGSGAEGILGVIVIVASPEVVAQVHDDVAPWLEPDQVQVTGALQPYDG